MNESVVARLNIIKTMWVRWITVLEVLQSIIPDLIFSSSCTVYGQPDQIQVDESAFAPMNHRMVLQNRFANEFRRMQPQMDSGLYQFRYFNPIRSTPLKAMIGELPIGIP